MTGGRIIVHGDAGNGTGGPLARPYHGMRGGAILVRGNAGNELGRAMQRGIIGVMGRAGADAAAHMAAGTVIIGGGLGPRPGRGLMRGTIVLLTQPSDILPTFRYICRDRPVFLGLYLQRLGAWDLSFPLPSSGRFIRFSGDQASAGRGELLYWDNA
jgi:formylmethanofuran dehydrogenase subunit C